MNWPDSALTVAELIAELHKWPQDAHVVALYDSGYASTMIGGVLFDADSHTVRLDEAW